MDTKELCKEAIRISGIDPRKCMKCGKCSATCPAFEDMDIHPHEFVSMLCDGRIDRLLTSKSLWRCVSCFACVERCPRGVEPAKLIEAARGAGKYTDTSSDSEDYGRLLTAVLLTAASLACGGYAAVLLARHEKRRADDR